MRGVVIEKKANKAIVLCDNGDVIQYKSRDNVGDNLVLYEKKKKSQNVFGKIFSQLFSVALICAVGFFAYRYVSSKEYSYVTFDNGYLYGLSLNATDVVVSVDRDLPDGTFIKDDTSQTELIGKSFGDAYVVLLNQMIEEGRLNPEGDIILISVSGGDEKRADQLKSKALKEINGTDLTKYETLFYSSTYEEKEKADELHISPIRYAMGTLLHDSNYEYMKTLSCKEVAIEYPDYLEALKNVEEN